VFSLFDIKNHFSYALDLEKKKNKLTAERSFDRFLSPFEPTVLALSAPSAK